MGTVGQGLSVPYDVSLYGMTYTNTDLPRYKTKALLRKPATLSTYHGIPPHWLSHSGFDWAQALSPFQCPDPWAIAPPVFPSPSVPDQDRAGQSSDATANPARDPTPVCPGSPISTRGIAPTPDPEEEEGTRHPVPSPPPPSPIPDDGVSIGDARRWSLRRSIWIFGG